MPGFDIHMSVQDVNGLCTKTKKCIKKDGHKDDCWPKEGK